MVILIYVVFIQFECLNDIYQNLTNSFDDRISFYIPHSCLFSINPILILNKGVLNRDYVVTFKRVGNSISLITCEDIRGISLSDSL